MPGSCRMGRRHGIGAALGAQDAVEEGALVKIGDSGVPCPAEEGARDAQDVVLRARLLRLYAVEELHHTMRAQRHNGMGCVHSQGLFPNDDQASTAHPQAVAAGRKRKGYQETPLSVCQNQYLQDCGPQSSRLAPELVQV